MAWGWSHTAEAYAAAERNLDRMTPNCVREIWAEWLAGIVNDYGSVDLEPLSYDYFYAIAEHIPAHLLTPYIWARASELATCDNGGWVAWMCPFGCGCHTVPFERR